MAMGRGCAFNGDTVLLIGSHTPDAGRCGVAVSFDGCQTVSPWHDVDSLWGYVVAEAALSHAYLFLDASAEWFPRVAASSDAGQTWSPLREPVEPPFTLQWGAASGNDVYRTLRTINVTPAKRLLFHSSDAGATWGPADTCLTVANDQAEEVRYAMALTRSHVLIIDQSWLPDSLPDHIYCTRASRNGVFLARPIVLPGQPFHRAAMGVTICGDTTSETAGVLSYISDYNSPTAHEPFVQMTHDGGQTWDSCISLSEGQRVIPSMEVRWPALFCSGKLWMAFWVQAMPTDSGLLWATLRFSPNHGRYWYPPQFVADTVLGAGACRGTIHGNRAQVLWAQDPTYHFSDVGDFRSVTGTILPSDTIAPVLLDAQPLPSEILPGSTVEFLATASDNDTVWEVTAVIRCSGSADSVIVPLAERISNSDFRGTWILPNDTAGYDYYYRVEDRWENAAVYPDSGLLYFHTPGWSSASSFIPQPSSFKVRVYPNPCNGWPSIQLSPDWFSRGPVTVSLFNITGQRVFQQGGVVSNSSLRQSAFPKSATGIYFLKIENRSQSATRKLLILR